MLLYSYMYFLGILSALFSLIYLGCSARDYGLRNVLQVRKEAIFVLCSSVIAALIGVNLSWKQQEQEYAVSKKIFTEQISKKEAIVSGFETYISLRRVS